MTAVVLRGDAAHLPLPDGSVDLVVTSPPYFGLRSYTDGDEHYGGQIGSEATPGEYLEALWGCTAEWVRVLKPGGSVFVNLGDKYSGVNGREVSRASQFPTRQGHSPDRRRNHAERQHGDIQRNLDTGIPAKSLMGLPWRYAIGCTDRLGLILRAEIVWAKPNGLPESVTDRVRRSHEQLFHFTRQPRYFSAVDEIREPSDMQNPRERYARRHVGDHAADPRRRDGETVRTQGHSAGWALNNPLGKLPGSVWEIPSQPLVVPERLGVDHFAAFPCGLPRRVILGWSPAGICVACGEGRRPVTDREIVPLRPGDYRGNARLNSDAAHGFDRRAGTHKLSRNTITGYACGCPVPDAPARPAIVLDPFAGTGTTMLVASVLGRIGIGIDRSGDYCRLARWRCSDPGERARALGVPKPPPVPDGQGSLFDDVEAV